MWSTYSTVLNQPFPTYKQHKKQLLVCLIAASTVFLMLYLLEPFNMNLLNSQQKLWYAFTYSSITLVTCIVLTIMIPWLLPQLFDESNWTVLKEMFYIFFILIVISGLNLISHHIFDKTPINFWEFLISIVYTLPLAAFPVSFSILLKQKWLKDKYRKEAILWNSMLQEYQTKIVAAENETLQIGTLGDATLVKQYQTIDSEPEMLILTGTGIGEVVEIEINKLLFISSADNYITVHYLGEQTIKTTILRNTLKNTATKTQHVKAIIRCHRSYIVNLHKVERVMGDAQGLKLLIKGVQEPILVGKSYLSTVKTLLQDFKPFP